MTRLSSDGRLDTVHVSQEFADLYPKILKHFEIVLRSRENASVIVRPFDVNASHVMRLLEVSGEPHPKIVIKGPRRHSGIHQDLSISYHILSTIAPKIELEDPTLTCPKLIGFDEAHGLLAIEFAEGELLYYRACNSPRRKELHDIKGAFIKAGQWLAHFHDLTEIAEEGNPFDYLLRRLESSKIYELYPNSWTERVWLELLNILKALRKERYTCRHRLCLIHGDFGIHHIILQKGRICVIDFASSHNGYAIEDLGFFIAQIDSLTPWRSLGGSMTGRFHELIKAFIDAYCSVNTGAIEAIDVLLRYCRIDSLSKITSAAFYEKGDNSGPLRVARQRWLRWQFRNVCQRELTMLRHELDHSTLSRGTVVENDYLYRR